MDFSFLPKYWAYFNYGVLVTIMISACVVFFGTIIGILVALVKRTNIKVLNWIASFYVWVFRGTPMVVQIMIAFAWMHFNNAPIVGFGVLDLDFSRLLPGIIIISLNSGAYISEIVRAGIEAVPKGQLEAAYSLGIRPVNAMRYVILPQALKNILPALGNEFVMMIKETSLASIFFIPSLMTAESIVSGRSGLKLESLIIVGLIYLMLTLPLSKLVQYYERKFAKND